MAYIARLTPTLDDSILASDTVPVGTVDNLRDSDWIGLERSGPDGGEYRVALSELLSVLQNGPGAAADLPGEQVRDLLNSGTPSALTALSPDTYGSGRFGVVPAA